MGQVSELCHAVCRQDFMFINGWGKISSQQLLKMLFLSVAVTSVPCGGHWLWSPALPLRS